MSTRDVAWVVMHERLALLVPFVGLLACGGDDVRAPSAQMVAPPAATIAPTRVPAAPPALVPAPPIASKPPWAAAPPTAVRSWGVPATENPPSDTTSLPAPADALAVMRTARAAAIARDFGRLGATMSDSVQMWIQCTADGYDLHGSFTREDTVAAIRRERYMLRTIATIDVDGCYANSTSGSIECYSSALRGYLPMVQLDRDAVGAYVISAIDITRSYGDD